MQASRQRELGGRMDTLLPSGVHAAVGRHRRCFILMTRFKLMQEDNRFGLSSGDMCMGSGRMRSEGEK